MGDSGTTEVELALDGKAVVLQHEGDNFGQDDRLGEVLGTDGNGWRLVLRRCGRDDRRRHQPERHDQCHGNAQQSLHTDTPYWRPGPCGGQTSRWGQYE